MSLDTDILRQELQAGDAKTAQLYDALSNLRSQSNTNPLKALLESLVLSPEEFERRVQREQTWCAQANDNLAIIEIAFDDALNIEEEAKLTEQLLEMANNPADFVAVTSDRAYAVGLASTDEKQAQRLLNVAIGMAAYAAPSRDFRAGAQNLTTCGPRPPIALSAAPARTTHHAVTAGRAL